MGSRRSVLRAFHSGFNTRFQATGQEIALRASSLSSGLVRQLHDDDVALRVVRGVLEGGELRVEHAGFHEVALPRGHALQEVVPLAVDVHEVRREDVFRFGRGPLRRLLLRAVVWRLLPIDIGIGIDIIIIIIMRPP